MNNREKGSAGEGALVLGLLIIILVFFILPQHGVLGPAANFTRLSDPTSYDSYKNSRTAQGAHVGTDSAYSSLISLGQGNAPYSIQPDEEYITITNRGSAPVNLTGWKLTNNKGNRTYEMSGNQIRYASDSLTIPQALAYIPLANSLSLPQNVVLKPGETAVVNTGSVGVQSPYKITSFKENECSGYLEALPQYSFTPQLTYMCVSPLSEPGASGLDSACKSFISSTVSSCETPVIGKYDSRSNDNCDNCVNGRPAPSNACLNFIKAHYSYEGCLANHKDDADFYGNTWRIFLGQKWEMWGKEDETISLFDQFGKLVSFISY